MIYEAIYNWLLNEGFDVRYHSQPQADSPYYVIHVYNKKHPAASPIDGHILSITSVPEGDALKINERRLFKCGVYCESRISFTDEQLVAKLEALVKAAHPSLDGIKFHESRLPESRMQALL